MMRYPSTPRPFLVALFLLSVIPLGNAFSIPTTQQQQSRASPLVQRRYMSTMASPPAAPADSDAALVVPPLPAHVASALKKASKTLTVGIEVSVNNDFNLEDLAILSMQLRKSNVNTIWTPHPNILFELAKEQATAKGDFPGPCSVVLWCQNNDGKVELEDTVLLFSADAVVLTVSEMANAKLMAQMAEFDVGAIWQVQSKSDIEQFSDQHLVDNALCFLVDAASHDQEAMDELLNAIPSNAIVIASLPSMQTDHAEITMAQALKQSPTNTKGVHSIVLRDAAVGDAEDLEYCTFAVSGLTKKQSSTFNMSGLTGSTNGHFGGVSTKRKKTWKRTMHNSK